MLLKLQKKLMLHVCWWLVFMLHPLWMSPPAFILHLAAGDMLKYLTTSD